MQGKRLVFPFSAIVGLDKLKLAILINAVNPKIGGLLIKGPKGSGKSTIIRALADILPRIEVIKDCPFNCNPKDPSNMCSKCSRKYLEKEKIPIEEREMSVVDLPLGATEDRVVGSLDVEKAIKHGIEALEPGILAQANQNVLYVDEVNLLPDHIADDLLDAAATGWNTVEREGISVNHPSRFIFVGTMNPEEGELRPQLLDRFPLSSTVEKIASVKARMEIVKRNMEFENDPEAFSKEYETLQEELRRRIAQAKEALKDVIIPKGLLASICEACLELKVDGLRPDIVIAKAAMALAALETRKKVTLHDVLVAAELALNHRTREGGFLEPATPKEVKEILVGKIKKMARFIKTGEKTEKKDEKHLKGRGIFWVKKDATKKEEEIAAKDNLLNKIRKKQFELFSHINRIFGGLVFAIGKRLKKEPKHAPAINGVQIGSNKLKGKVYKETFNVKKDKEKKAIPSVSEAAGLDDVSEGYPFISNLVSRLTSPSQFFLKMSKAKGYKRTAYAGKRAQTVTTLYRGKPYRWRLPKGKPADIHLPATIRAAARKQNNRRRSPDTAVKICFGDIREKLRLYKAPMTMIFVVDLSGSMLLNIDAIKEALLKLHGDAYRYRDRVGIVALKGVNALVIQHPVTNLRVVANKLLKLRISGFTPLAAGMMKAMQVLEEAKRRDPSTVPVMVIVTDGSANVPLKRNIETGEIRQIERVRIIVREYEDIAVDDVLSVSKMIKKNGIHTIVINTNPHLQGRETYGHAVTKIIAKITNGSHNSIGRKFTKAAMIDDMIEEIKESQRRILQDGSSLQM